MDRAIRWGGVPAILGGLLFPAAALLHPAGEDLTSVLSSNWRLAHLLGWLSLMLLHLGLVAIYARQAPRTGWLGLSGFVLAFVGGAFAAAIQFLAATAVPLVAEQAPNLFEQVTTPPAFAPAVLVGGLVLGHVLFGIATFRAAVFPRWSGALLAIGVVMFFAGEVSFLGDRFALESLRPTFETMRQLRPVVILGDFAFGLSLAWMGLFLLRSRDTR